MMYPHEDKQKNHSFLFEVSSFAFGEIRGRVFCFLLVLIPDRDRDRQLRTWTNDTIKKIFKIYLYNKQGSEVLHLFQWTQIISVQHNF